MKHGISELRCIVQQTHLLSGLEWWQPNVRAAIATESITQRAVTARPGLALDCKVQLVQIVRLQSQGVEVLVGFGTAGFVFGFELGSEAAGTVLAGASSLSRLGLALRCWSR
jgi:hypothetical protein